MADVTCTVAQNTVDCTIAAVIQNAADATVKNSDNTFSQTISSGGTYTLTDTTFEIYLDGVLSNTTVLPSMVAETLNITLT